MTSAERLGLDQNTVQVLVLTEVWRNGEDHVGAADPDSRRGPGTDLKQQSSVTERVSEVLNTCMAPADLSSEPVQKQVQNAARGLHLLLGVLLGQPAERSAAGAPGEVSTLRGGRSVT